MCIVYNGDIIQYKNSHLWLCCVYRPQSMGTTVQIDDKYNSAN